MKKRSINPYKSIKKDFEYKVVLANQIACCRASFSLLQHRILIKAIVQIKPKDIDFREYEVSFKNIVKGSSSYPLVLSAIEKMQDSEIWIFSGDNWYSFNLVEKIKVAKIKNKLIVFLTFNPDLKKYFIGLSQNYLSYPYVSILDFKSAYSLRIYELCKQYEQIGVRTLTLDYLKYILSVEKKYPYFGNFEQRVLKIALFEINKYSDIYVDFGKIKDVDEDYSLIFKIRRNTNYAELLKTEKSRIEQDL